MTSLHRAVEVLADRRKTVAFTGAGVSTDSRIPDFRSPRRGVDAVRPSAL